MKKNLIILAIFISTIFFGACSTTGDVESYLRIHIRANSNLSIDQTVKYAIKDEVVDYLTPIIARCESFDEVKSSLNVSLNAIKFYVDNILQKLNFDYKCNVSINNEFFPTRYYDGFVLESNFYDALIIELGEATGDNWWCVVYPPLCFVGADNGSSNFVYKSKLLELINNFFN